MSNALPYLHSPGSIVKLLGKVKTASVPDRFSQEFLNTTLNMKGGSANSLISFLKKMGFLDGAGIPTARYKEFRNEKKSGAAIAAALRQLYAPLYNKNEAAHSLGRSDLEGLIVEYTGKTAEDRTTELAVATFETLKKLADFKKVATESPDKDDKEIIATKPDKEEARRGRSIHLGYTINLHLPATKDVEVFNAIFRSLKQHLMEEP
jgi:hypothetical protein